MPMDETPVVAVTPAQNDVQAPLPPSTPPQSTAAGLKAAATPGTPATSPGSPASAATSTPGSPSGPSYTSEMVETSVEPNPSSAPSTSEAPLTRQEAILFYSKMALFIFILFGTCLGVLALQIPMLLLYLHSHTLFRSGIRITEQMFGSMVILMVYIFCPGTALVLTGDFDKFKGSKSKSLVFANHQIYPDWLYLWSLAWSTGNHGDVKIVLMEWLSRLPIFGQGMWFFEFIFMKQKWAVDKDNMTRLMKLSKNPNIPMWFLIFPEGTLNTPGNVTKSKAYAKKMGIKNHPNHVILPKSTGLQHCLATLHPDLDDVFDLTVGYSGLSATDIPYYFYLIDKIFFRGIYPRRIHIHIDHIPTSRIPGIVPNPQSLATGLNGLDTLSEEDKTVFNTWLRERYMIKDERMGTFYRTGRMIAEPEGAGVLGLVNKGGDVEVRKKIVALVPELQDWIAVGFAFYVVGWLLPYYWWWFMLLPRLFIFGF
ncbi:hypothetical protein HDU76_002127 [Blyttiomyces sp. JEL0837]|nr:hypothetical protein HDU76_002127 [Blyttiomyces sp. JEL0837]